MRGGSTTLTAAQVLPSAAKLLYMRQYAVRTVNACTGESMPRQIFFPAEMFRNRLTLGDRDRPLIGEFLRILCYRDDAVGKVLLRQVSSSVLRKRFLGGSVMNIQE